MNSEAARRSIALVRWCYPPDRARVALTKRREINVVLQLDETIQPVSQSSFKVKSVHLDTGRPKRTLKLDHEP